MSEPSNRPRRSEPEPPQHPVTKRRKWPLVVLVVLLLVVGGCLAAVGLVVSEVSDEVDEAATVTYEVTGDAREVTISRSVQGAGAPRTEPEVERVTDLPWRREAETSGQVTSSTLVVTVGAHGGEATCRVRVDDGPVRTATASGPHATAVCKAP